MLAYLTVGLKPKACASLIIHNTVRACFIQSYLPSAPLRWGEDIRFAHLLPTSYAPHPTLAVPHLFASFLKGEVTPAPFGCEGYVRNSVVLHLGLAHPFSHPPRFGDSSLASLGQSE